MEVDLQNEIERFRSFAGYGQIELLGPDVLRFKGEQGGLKVGFLALVHGNEILGLPLVNRLLSDLSAGRITTPHDLYFGLGNLPAAYAGKRFLQKDLNRCFGRQDSSTPEDLRARELETCLLNHVDYLIDFHQTIQPTLQPFFIFQHASVACFNHLSLMNPGITTILQFDAIGDSQNLSTDEYLRGRERFGVALELGQIGQSEQMFELGYTVSTKFISSLTGYSNFRELNRATASPGAHRFFEINGRMTATRDGSILHPQWQNFMYFERGEILGSAAGEELVAEQSGVMLFPKPGQIVSRGTDLFHICQPIGIEKLSQLSALTATVAVEL